MGTGFVVAEGQLVGEGRGGGVEVGAVGVAVHDEGQVGGAAGEVRGGEGGGGWGCGEGGGGGGGGGGGVEGSGAGCEGEGGGEDEEGGEVLHFGGCLLREADGILIWRRITATVFLRALGLIYIEHWGRLIQKYTEGVFFDERLPGLTFFSFVFFNVDRFGFSVPFRLCALSMSSVRQSFEQDIAAYFRAISS